VGLPVVAGPAEGTVMGNLLVRARAVGAVGGDLADLHRIVAASAETVAYAPEGPQSLGEEVARRIRPLSARGSGAGA
jgi:rhamnulokinase